MDPTMICVLSLGLMCGGTVQAADERTPTLPAVDDAQPEADPGPAGSASKVLAQVQAFYNGTTDLQADFTQTYVHAVYGTRRVSKGTLKVAKPKAMLWDYAKADNPDFYVDGKQLWIVERDTKQVIRKTVDSSDFAGADKFLFGGRQLVEDFKVRLAPEQLVEQYGMKGHQTIQLKPKKKNPHYAQLLLVVQNGTGRVDAFVVRNHDGSINHFVLSDLETNAGLTAKDLAFRKPAGFAVVRE